MADIVSLSYGAQQKNLGAECYAGTRYQGYVIQCKDDSNSSGPVAFGGTPGSIGPCPDSFDDADPDLFNKFIGTECYLGANAGYYYICTQQATRQPDGTGIAWKPSTACTLAANAWNNAAIFDMQPSGEGRVCYDINLYHETDTAANGNHGRMSGEKQTVCYCRDGYYASSRTADDKLVCTPCPSVDGKTIPSSNTGAHTKLKSEACCLPENTTFKDDRGSGYLRSPCCASN